MRSRVVVWLCAIPLLLAGVRAQKKGLPPSHTCQVTIADPLPWLEAALKSDSLRRAFRSGMLGDALTIAGYYDDLVPSTLWRRIRTFKQFIPQEITVAFPSPTGGAVGGVMRMLVARDLLHATYMDTKLAEDQLTKVRKELRGELVQALAPIPKIAFALSLRCRDDRTAAEWYEAVVEVLEVWPEKNEGMTLEVDDERARLLMPLDDFVTPEAFAAFFTEWVTDDEEVLAQVYESVKGLRIVVEARVDGEALLFRFSPERAEAEQSAPHEGRRVPQLSGEGLASFQLDMREFVAQTEGAAQLWQRYGKTKLGKICLEYDSSDILGDLDLIAREAKRIEDVAGAITWDEAGIRYAADMPAIAATRIQDAGIWQFVPEEAAGYAIDGSTTIPRVVYDLMLNIENQVENQRFRQVVDGGAGAEELSANLDDYYERVAGIRELLRDEGTKVFQPPSLRMVATTPAGIGFGPQAGFVVANRLRPGRDGVAYVRKLIHEIVDAIGKPDAFDENGLDVDLGLGVKTVSFPFRQFLPAPEGDLHLHAFVLDGHLIVSTSKAVSRAIIAQRERPRVSACGPQTIHKGAINGARVGVWLMAIGEQLGRLLADPRFGSVDVAGPFRLIMAGFADTARLFGGCDFETVIAANGRREEGELRFLASPRAGELAEVLEKVAKALGPWPDRVGALRASGDSFYQGVDGKFTFTCGRDGYYHNRIKALAYEENIFTGKAWSITEGGCSRTVGNFERDLLVAWDAIWSGQWIDRPQGMRVELAPDVLPGQAPELMLRFPSSRRAVRVWLDPTTWLPTAFSPEGRSLIYRPKIRLSDYRLVRGRMLPYLAEGEVYKNRYRVKSWKPATLRPGKPQRPPMPKDAKFKGDAKVPFEFASGGVVQVRAGGKKVWLQFNLMVAQTLISRRALREMGCSVAEDDKWTTVKRLRIGPMTIENLAVQVIDSPEATDDDKPETLHGVIGLEVAMRACIELDYAKKSLELRPPGAFKNRKADFVPLGYSNRGPSVPLHLDRRTVVDCELFFPPSNDKLTFYDCSRLTDFRVPRKSMRIGSDRAAARGFLQTTLPAVKLAGQRLDPVAVGWPIARYPEFAQSGPLVFMSARLLYEDFILLLDIPGERAAFVPR